MKISQWDHIHNPVTGEHLRFLRRDPETASATVEVIFPAGASARAGRAIHRDQ